MKKGLLVKIKEWFVFFVIFALGMTVVVSINHYIIGINFEGANMFAKSAYNIMYIALGVIMTEVNRWIKEGMKMVDIYRWIKYG